MNQSPTVTRRILARQVAAQVDGLSLRLAKAAVDAVTASIEDALAADSTVQIKGFGTFSVRQRAARQTFHPRTQQPIAIPAASVPHYSPSPQHRDRVSAAHALASSPEIAESGTEAAP
ncbi:MAG: HU family DNA-binding protein [Cyanobacteria bacterium J06639_1]